MENENRRKISRRDFMKTGLAVTSVAALSSQLMPANRKGLIQGSTRVQVSNENWIKSYCSSCIWANCGTEVKVVDGIAVEIRGNEDHPSNQGTLCPRGAAQLMNVYNPYRVKAPMKRTNPEKGLDVDPGWVEISWEEAFQTVADHIKQIQATDPRKLAYMVGFASNPHELNLVKIFLPIFSVSNYLQISGPLCDVHYAPSLFTGNGIDSIDLGYCNFLINFGRNIGGSAMYANGPGRALADALERGMKLVVVDPRASPEASKGEWVPIRPATDTAFAMAMLYLILHEINRYDAESLKTRTNAPYLINDQGDYQRDVETGKPLVWDLEDNQAKTFDDATIKDLALEGEFEVAGGRTVPAFVLLKESVADSTPEWAEPLCGVPATKIRQLTQQLVEEAQVGATIVIDGFEFPYRPAAISVGRGAANTAQGRRFYVLANTINAVLGGMGVPGSIISAMPGPVLSAPDGVMAFQGAGMAEAEDFRIPQGSYNNLQFYPIAPIPNAGAFFRSILDPDKYYLDYEIEALFIYGGNPIQNLTDYKVVEAALAKIPFTFTVAYHIDESALFADILFPEASHYERYQARLIGDIMAVGRDSINVRGFNYKAPVLDQPLYDTKQFDDVVIELADRCGLLPMLNSIFNGFNALPPDKGLDPMKKYTYAEMLDVFLKASTGDSTKGADFFREQGFLVQQIPHKEFYDYYHIYGNARMPVYDWAKFNAGKILRANLEEAGINNIPGWDDMGLVYREYIPLPQWQDNFITEPSDDFDLFVTNWKTGARNLGVGGVDDNVWLREIVETWDFDDLRIQMNTATAHARGLKTGDHILVESQHGGHVEGVLKTTDLLHPEVVGFPAQAGRRSKFMNPRTWQGSNYNQLLSSREGIMIADSGSVVNTARVKVSKV